MGTFPGRLRSGKASLTGAVVVAALMVFVLPSGIASAAPLSTASGSSNSWAYGNVVNVSFSGHTATGVPYVGNATYGYTVLLTQTNLSSTVFELNAGRTAGVAFAVEYCSPTCKAPTYFVRVSAHLVETVNSTAYLENDGTVQESGGSVPAYALLNSSTVETANETESMSSYLPVAGASPAARSSYLAGEVSAATDVQFASPLGLFPTNLSSSQSWTSEASFTANALATYHYFVAVSGRVATWSLAANGTIPVSASGAVNLSGSYSSTDSVALGGVPFPEVSLGVTGPFALEEGVILVPVASDLFLGASHPWSANESGAATAEMSYVDFRGGLGGHLGIGASRWQYDSVTLDPASTQVPSNTAGITELAGTGTPDAAPSTTVQGQPESAAQSAQTQACLLTGSGCPSSSVSGTIHGLLGVAALGVLAAVALALAVVVVERRRMPPPTYPNASLYPPGGGPANGARSGPDEPPAPSPDDDPLGNLW